MTAVLRQEVGSLGIRVTAVEPGAFGIRAYAGFADEPVQGSVADYAPMLEAVRATMVKQNGRQPGDPARGVRAILAAMAEDEPPTFWSSAAPDGRCSAPRSPRGLPYAFDRWRKPHTTDFFEVLK
ncbi:Rossmann-fold NAD(P)-binding domain-containing protein [Micromonospora inositola]|uniref:hypothetical protein n=1 Tax=Micromonospora inositola TaxID=47865 RepID=UPI000B5ADDE1|nr:hypothetical protein [Micromonospora inositola]